MKKYFLHAFFTACLLGLCTLGCQKDSDIEQIDDTAPAIFADTIKVIGTPSTDEVQFPVQKKFSCQSGLIYGDSVLQVDENKGNKDQIILPVGNGSPGKYLSWPKGLSIDSITGAINVSRSDQGARYVVGFVPIDGKDTCLQYVIISGVSYLDGIYSLSEQDTLVRPIYDANPSKAPFCDESGADDYFEFGKGKGNDKCVFDGKGKDGKEQKLNKKKIRIRSISGIIDLKYTLASGAFGASPRNGQEVRAVLSYQLNRNGKKALQELEMVFVYYKSRADIPQDLQDYIANSRQNILNFNIASFYGRPRPPLIVIVN
jgi:hypothetical protein